MSFGSLALNFTLFYQSGIKPFTRTSQKVSVNLLLVGKNPVDSNTADYETLSDSIISGYANGTKDIKDEFRQKITNAPIEDIALRIEQISLWDPACSAASLKELVKRSSLSAVTKEKLLKKVKDVDDITAIAMLFVDIIRIGSDAHTLSKEEKELLNECIAIGKMVADDEKSGHNRVLFSTDDTGDSLIRDLFPAKYSDYSFEYQENAITIVQNNITLPQDIVALAKSLENAFASDSVYEGFSFRQLIDTLGISSEGYALSSGTLEYYCLRGSFNQISEYLTKSDFKAVSAFVYQIAGPLKKADAEEGLPAALKKASNPNVTLLSAVIIIPNSDHVELRLIAHFYPEKAKQQIKDDADTKTYQLRSRRVS